MAKKTKKQTKKQTEKRSRTVWFVLCAVLAVLIIFTLTRMGPFGILSNNLLTYLAGSLYMIPLLSLFFYGAYYLFINEEQSIPSRVTWGLALLNVFFILLGAYICHEVSSFEQFGHYLRDRFQDIGSGSVFSFTGGLIGDLLYLLILLFASRSGVLIIMVVLVLCALILIVPAGTYRKAYSNTKEQLSKRNQDIKQKKEQARAQWLKAEEDRKAKQAEMMAKKAEEDELKKAEQEKLAAEQKKLAEEKRRQQEEAERIRRQKEEKRLAREKILSHSGTFINLEEPEEEIKPETEQVKETKPVEIPLVKEVQPSQNESKVYRAGKKKGTYHLPRPFKEFLEPVKNDSSNINKTSASIKGEKLLDILQNFGIEASLVQTYIGPSVTKFEIKPDKSVKINRIQNISDNIKMELEATDIRIEAPIPGRSAVGVEVPNVETIPVKMLDLMRSMPAEKDKNRLLFALGKDLMGQAVYCDLAKMPHLLIAGATGSGKSVCINSIITSYLLRTDPNDVKLVLVDPKKVEFTPYKDIPHLLWPIIDDAQMAANMLKRVVVMMQDRYDLFAQCGVRNIASYNEYVAEYNQSLHSLESTMEPLPYIVLIIDELADLMAIAGKDVELSIQRITQLARASGIHLIVATQRPSTDVITGLIKSNIPSRISFAVASSIDSRTILDQTGAERLLGNGDMLYYPQGETAPIRLQGVYVTDKEIAKLTAYVKKEASPEYEDSYYEFLTNMTETTVMGTGAGADATDSLYDEVVEFVKGQQRASTSLLQRHFGIGYNRAARIIDTLEDRGVIGPANGAKPREVFLKPDEE